MPKVCPLALLAALAAACASPQSPPAPASGATLFEGARLIDGNGGPPIESSAILVDGDSIVLVGRKGEAAPPAGARVVDLGGKTVMPALVDAHSHLGYTDVKGMTTAAANFTRENLVDHLRRYAYYGLAATLSMGVDRGEIPYQVRANPLAGAALFRTAGRGLALPDAGPGAEYRRDAALGVSSEPEARAAVAELAAKQVDIVKIWVDDRDGTVAKLPPPLYRAIIDEAHARGLRVAAHIFDLEDAKELLRSGVDGFAHGVRDRDVDDEFMTLIKARPAVWVIPNLPENPGSQIPDPRSRSQHPNGDEFEWLRDTVPAAEIQRLRSEPAARTPAAARRAGALYDVQARNLARLNAAGVKIGYGTDAGISVGWTAHTELADMVAAGMTSSQVLVAATRTAAEIMRLDRLGTLAPGKSADFIVLDGNPLDDITNTRRIADVYLRGVRVDRAALAGGWK
jgi:imidazolonepropionase-like amidohydrolase